MRRLLLISFTFVFSGLGAQRLLNLSLLYTSGAVTIKFTIGKGNNCGGYNIYHSSDSVNYNLIHEYAGVCGASGSDEHFSYTHSSPAGNKVNFYRVELHNPFEAAKPQKIYVPGTPKNDLTIYPTPLAGSTLAIRAAYNGNETLSGFIYDQFGNPLKKLDLATREDMADIPVFDLPSGIYFIWFTNRNKNYSGRFIISR